MLVFDGSGSMAAMGYNGLDRPRIIDARDAIDRTMPKIARHRRVGLVVYGPGANDGCASVSVRFPPIANAAPRIIAEVHALDPSGDTPLTQAIEQAALTLDYRNHTGVIVLVTDGKETCGGAPCQLASLLAADAAGLTVHVIGFQVRGDFFNWRSQGESDYENSISVARCLADITGGTYHSTETAEQLAQALAQTLSCQLIGRTQNRQQATRG